MIDLFWWIFVVGFGSFAALGIYGLWVWRTPRGSNEWEATVGFTPVTAQWALDRQSHLDDEGLEGGN